MVVARPDARELAEREGMPGIRRALAELVDGMAGEVRRREHRARRIAITPVRAYQRFISQQSVACLCTLLAQHIALTLS